VRSYVNDPASIVWRTPRGCPVTAARRCSGNQAKRQPVKLIAGIVNKYASYIVVKEIILRERGVSQTSPIAQRIGALNGLRLATTGAGGAPDSLFRYLFAAYGFNR
jgi:NitT/TauT family transport system substrate-binding protein